MAYSTILRFLVPAADASARKGRHWAGMWFSYRYVYYLYAGGFLLLLLPLLLINLIEKLTCTFRYAYFLPSEPKRKFSTGYPIGGQASLVTVPRVLLPSRILSPFKVSTCTPQLSESPTPKVQEGGKDNFVWIRLMWQSASLVRVQD